MTATKGQAGIAVDARGGPVIDPTQNVRELVLAESKYQDAMRDALGKIFSAKHEGLHDTIKAVQDGVISFQNAMRDAETRRIDQLAETRQEFQNTIRDMLAESVRTTSTLVSTQLVQIQATFDTRVSKLEAGAFTQAGKSSVADPALSEALQRMTAAVAALQTSGNRTTFHDEGAKDTNARLFMILMALAAVAGPVMTFMAMRGK